MKPAGRLDFSNRLMGTHRPVVLLIVLAMITYHQTNLPAGSRVRTWLVRCHNTGCATVFPEEFVDQALAALVFL